MRQLTYEELLNIEGGDPFTYDLGYYSRKLYESAVSKYNSFCDWLRSNGSSLQNYSHGTYPGNL